MCRAPPTIKMATSDKTASAGGPRDAAVMEAILKEMGVTDYEPNVIHQMLELSYRKKFKKNKLLNPVLFYHRLCGKCIRRC